MATAGRTVLFSALTVSLAMATMTMFPMYFLKSLGYAGVAVVALAATASVVITPAALAFLGPRMDSLDVRRLVRRILAVPSRRRAPSSKPSGTGGRKPFCDVLFGSRSSSSCSSCWSVRRSSASSGVFPTTGSFPIGVVASGRRRHAFRFRTQLPHRPRGGHSGRHRIVCDRARPVRGGSVTGARRRRGVCTGRPFASGFRVGAPTAPPESRTAAPSSPSAPMRRSTRPRRRHSWTGCTQSQHPQRGTSWLRGGHRSTGTVPQAWRTRRPRRSQ